jgi:DNA modification methylase
MTVSPGDQHVRKVLADLEGPTGKGREFDSAIHPFPARMPLSVANHLIANLTTRGQTVLDPMAGSGTTLVVAARQGRSAIGFDRDPLAVLIARTATCALDRERVEGIGDRILERAREFVSTMRLPQTRKTLPREDREFLRYWFPSRSQKQLFALAAAITDQSVGSERDFAWVVFSSLIIAKSAGASFALDISRSRPHKRPEKQIVLPFEGWRPRFKAAMSRHPFIDAEPRGEVEVRPGDVRSLPLPDGEIDFVLTSPPYVTAIDYLRAHKFSLVWMGHELETLRELRGTMMGTERGLWSRDGLPTQMEEQLEELVTVSRRKAILRRYLSDFRTMLGGIHRVLRPGGLAVLVVGPMILEEAEPDAVPVVTELAESVDLDVVGSAVRTISAARRSLPPPSPRKNRPLDQRMREEVLVALRK